MIRREWSIADGPASIDPTTLGTTVTLVLRREQEPPVSARLDVLTLTFNHGLAHFTGRLHLRREIIAIAGIYDSSNRSGSCFTTA